jgi:putative ABC transport system permease protein
MRQLLTESVVLALFGGALGVLMAQVGTRLFVILAPTWYLPAEEIHIDGTVLGFTLGLSLLTAILFGMAPALRASNPDLARSLQQGGRGSPGGSRPLVQNLLVGSQIALTLVLLAGAALMVNSFVRLRAVDRGFNPERLLTARVSLHGERYVTWGQRDGREIIVVSPEVDVFYREVLERLQALPGVEAAEMVSPSSRAVEFTLPGRPAPPPTEEPTAQFREASPGYFPVMGIPLLKGRSFTDRDSESSLWVAIINETMARQYFPDEDPIGRLLQARLSWPGQGEFTAYPFSSKRQPTPAVINKPREIVGVLSDTRQSNPRRAPDPTIYVPHTQHPTEYRSGSGVHSGMQLVLRTTLEPMYLAAELRRIVAGVDPEEVVYGIQSMEALLDGTVRAERFWMRALGIFATLALVLAVVGIYGVVSYSVAQRTHEIGVRRALGAQRTDVLGLVIRQGMVVSAAGVIVGVLGAVVATRLLSSWLYGVEATDPVTFATVSLVLVGIALLATYVPARRAARVDPLIALRSE